MVKDNPAKGVPEMGIDEACERTVNIRDAKSGKDCGNQKPENPYTERNPTGCSRRSHDRSICDISNLKNRWSVDYVHRARQVAKASS
jgi:hypothetical protein